MDVFTVSRLNALVKRVLEREFVLKNCFVSGTIANLKRHSTGHYYFSLKDEDASIDVALWASTAFKRGLVGKLENGLFVTMRASINFYEKTGRLSLICNEMEIGEKSPYQLVFEALKKELTELGYFDEAHKKELPEMPTTIGLVTSSSGAVLHDILHVAASRNPLVQFKLFSVPVQGEKAAPQIAKGIARADKDPDVELIIVGRGGGSAEDLWCFNDRAVVEAVYNCKTPIVSAVGHETDYTLCDFAADVRGATPSHAAELTVFPIYMLQQRLEERQQFLQHTMNRALEQRRMQLQTIFNRKLGMPVLTLLHQERSKLQDVEHRITAESQRQLQEASNALDTVTARLEVLNPLRLLHRGYSKLAVKGEPVASIEKVTAGDEITASLADGTIQAVVKEVTPYGR